MKYLDNLNEKQQEAVEHIDGPLLVIAGAGSGKTRVVTSRIIHLINQGVAPDSILAITFTNKAAREMRERVMEAMGVDRASQENTAFERGNRGSPHLSTFHALGVFILRQHGEIINVPSSFTIFDSQKSRRLVKELLKERGYDPKEWSPRGIQSAISRHKGEGFHVENLDSHMNPSPQTDVLAAVWPAYEKRLAEEGACDFDDLLLKPVDLLRENESARQFYRDKWSHLHVDEYQDTNQIQCQLVRLLADDKHNICAVGDEDQTIYTWRGAEIDNILSFTEDYPGACTIQLEKNYRSTGTILEAANNIITKNTIRSEKNIITDNPEGEKVKLLVARDETHEAQQIADKLSELNQEELADTAILYRTNFQSRALEEALLSRRIPYQLVGTKFFDRKEVRDILSYLRLAVNPRALSDLQRIINTPRRGIGKKTQEKVFSGNTDDLSARQKRAVDGFFTLIDKVRKKSEELPPHELIQFVFEHSGIKDDLESEGEEGRERMLNIGELTSLATTFAPENSDNSETGTAPKALESFLENAALMTDQDDISENVGGAKLMTVHAAKGLEFDRVIISGLEDGLFPQKRDESGIYAQEEERRLFYVALTRAKREVYLSYARARTVFGNYSSTLPSEFLMDIPDELLEAGDPTVVRREKVVYLDDF